MASGPFLSSVATTWSGVRTCRPSTSWMSRPCTVPGPSLSMRTVYVFAVAALSTTSLRLRTISVTSSTTSVTVVNSWRAPSTRSAVMAAPWSDERRIRRSELPMAMPYPRSRGSAVNFPEKPVSVSLSMWMPRGRMRSRQLRVTMFDVLMLSSSSSPPLADARGFVSLSVHAVSPARFRTRSPAAPVTCPCAAPPRLPCLPRVILDDVLLTDGRLVQLFTHRHPLERPREVDLVELQPRELCAFVDLRHRRDDLFDLAALLADLDLVARAQDDAGDVDAPPVHQDVPVAHDLARLRAREGEAEAVHDVVEPRLEESQHLLAGAPLPAGRVEVVLLELALDDAVDATHLLLLAEADRVLAQLDAGLAVLPRGVGPAG